MFDSKNYILFKISASGIPEFWFIQARYSYGINSYKERMYYVAALSKHYIDLRVCPIGGVDLRCSLIRAIQVCAAPKGMVINRASILADFGYFGHK